jgi:hypothetical protein
MRYATIVILIGTLALTALPAAAQSADVFGGYQLTHFDGGTNFNGWNAALTGNFGHFLGITGDFSGVYHSGAHFHTYTFGPEVHARGGAVKLFAHGLFGAGTASVGSASTNGFVMFFGGGADYKIQKYVSVRVGQLDWMITRFNGVTDKSNFRYSAGAVLHF